MCERYVLPDQATAEREFLPARPWWKFTARFNVAAQQYVPAIRWHDAQSEAGMMRWGLIPAAAEGRAGQAPLTVYLEGVLDWPTSRGPWIKRQRRSVPTARFDARQWTVTKDR